MRIAALKRSALVLLASSLAMVPVRSSAKDSSRSPGKAALMSLLVPGTGELYAGGPRSGRFFLFMEGMFWTGMAVFKSLESSRTDTYRAFAAAHAGVRLNGKPERFIEEVALFQSIYTRNDRERYVAGDLANLRPETADAIWEWDAEASRLKFQDLRSRATSAEQKAFLFIGALVFNRCASALNAASIARKTRSVSPEGSVQLSSAVDPSGGASLRLRVAF